MVGHWRHNPATNEGIRTRPIDLPRSREDSKPLHTATLFRHTHNRRPQTIDTPAIMGYFRAWQRGVCMVPVPLILVIPVDVVDIVDGMEIYALFARVPDVQKLFGAVQSILIRSLSAG
jgi:hypothetical protein